MARGIGDSRAEGIHLGSLGMVHHMQGRLDDAFHHFQHALALSREIGDLRSEGIHLGNLALVFRAKDQLESAIEHLRQAIQLAENMGEQGILAHHLGNLGDALVHFGELDEAEHAFRQSILIGDEAFPIVAGAFRGSLALLLAQRGGLNEALQLLEEGEGLLRIFPEEHAKFLCKKDRSDG